MKVKAVILKMEVCWGFKLDQIWDYLKTKCNSDMWKYLEWNRG